MCYLKTVRVTLSSEENVDNFLAISPLECYNFQVLLKSCGSENYKRISVIILVGVCWNSLMSGTGISLCKLTAFCHV